MSIPKKQIVALGGGGFSQNAGVSPIDKYILNLTGKKYPKVSFLATASGDSANYIKKFYESFSDVDCHLSHLDLFDSQGGFDTPSFRTHKIGTKQSGSVGNFS